MSGGCRDGTEGGGGGGWKGIRHVLVEGERASLGPGDARVGVVEVREHLGDGLKGAVAVGGLRRT